ncbi:hypothetical protein RND71_033972 [Anisodus tanguticus]|uniref:Uncharacterized protein n=1 Tax=Anisodus tanguticus TaxID=243964 RepID=A0AAE1UWL9_9SOLA|nr:hypothetical protein RND71_033972 [Anisodus tanguticus]
MRLADPFHPWMNDDLVAIGAEVAKSNINDLYQFTNEIVQKLNACRRGAFIIFRKKDFYFSPSDVELRKQIGAATYVEWNSKVGAKSDFKVCFQLAVGIKARILVRRFVLNGSKIARHKDIMLQLTRKSNPESQIRVKAAIDVILKTL